MTGRCLACGADVEIVEDVVYDLDAGRITSTETLVHDGPGDAACRWFLDAFAADRDTQRIAAFRRMSQR